MPAIRLSGLVPFFIALSLLFSAGARSAVVEGSGFSKERPLRLGISEFADFSVNLPIIPATIQVIKDLFGEDHVSVKTYSVANLQTVAKQGQVDVILSSAGTYRRLAIEGAGVTDLATVVSTRAMNPNYADGSVFFTLAERADINTVADLRNKSISANHKYAFSGWQTAMGELLRQGFDPDHFFADVRFKGHDMPLVVEAVQKGEVDGGIVRACFLEDMGIDTTQFKVLDSKPNAGKIDCLHSTALYPNWTISTLPSTSPEISRRIAAALLSMQPIENGLHWSLATDFRGIDQLFLDLKIGPYAYLRQFSLTRLIAQYSLPFSIALASLLALLLHSVTVSGLVKRRTQELEESVRREKQLEEESRMATERFSALQKVGIVGQMSSIIAHELRQPLATISMYGYGLLRRLESGQEDRDVTVRSLEHICEQTKRASDIVDQVRTYAKGNRARSLQSLESMMNAAVTEMRKSSRRRNARIELEPPPQPVWIEANPLEIELIFINLMKNAVDAVPPDRSPYVRLRMALRDECTVEVTVTDNGPRMSEEDWEKAVRQSLRSTKEMGLGLGLSIVRSLTEDMGGTVEFGRSEEGGLSITIVLECTTTSKKKEEADDAVDSHS